MIKLSRQMALFDVTENSTDVPFLKGRRCKNCGYVIFPPQDYGCDRCGGAPEMLEPVALKGRGILKSFITEHKYPSRQTTPSIVGEIILEEGPVAQAMIDCNDASKLVTGQKMRGILIEDKADSDGVIYVDYYFTTEEDGHGTDA